MKASLCICVFAVAAIFWIEKAVSETLYEWDYTKLSAVNLWSKIPKTATSTITKDIRTPESKAALEVNLDNRDSSAVPEDIQLRYLYNGALKTGSSYEIYFKVKASIPGSIQMVAAEADKPWSAFSGAIKNVNVTKEWQLVKLVFTSKKDWAGTLALPRIMLGRYGATVTIYLGPVTLRELPTLLEYNLGNPEWRVFIGAKEPKSFDAIPTEIGEASGIIKGHTLQMNGDVIDLDHVSSSPAPKESALLYKEFDSAAAGRMQIGVSADWWMELFINGEKVFNTLASGNVSRAFSVDDHVVEIPVKAGKNILVAKVLSGSNGWKFVCGKPSRGLDEDSLYVARESAEWKPLDMSRVTVQAGTALDFSTLAGERSPAGERGRVIVNRNGSLAFEKDPERGVKFFSYNTNPWRLSSAKITNEELDRYAADIAKQGYTMVRIQGVDMFLLGVYRPPFTASTYGSSDWLPQRAEDIQFNAASFDRFDFLLSCFKKHGIYINLDLTTMPGAYSNVIYPPSPARFKTQIFSNPEYRKHWELAVTCLLRHTNPYTGMTLGSDPALAIVEPYNEQDLLLYDSAVMREFSPAFRQYLRNKYKTADALKKMWNDAGIEFEKTPDISEDLLRKGDARAMDAGQFLVQSMSEITDWYHGVIRRAGYQGLLTQWDMIMRTLELPVRAKMPLIAQHTYFEHPNPLPSKNLVPKSKAEVIWPDKDMAIGHGSSLDSSYYRAAAAIRFLDRPFLITEYSHSAPSRFRHERGLYFGSYAALQGWDSLAAHGSFPVVVKGANDVPFCGFENPQDPISRASEVVAALTWFRGDVKEATHTVRLNISSKTIFPKNLLGAIGDDYAKLSMLTRLGITYPEATPLEPVGKAKASVDLTPAEFSPLSVNQWYASASNRDGGLFPSLLQELRNAGVLPESNKTDYSKRVYQSETGEITLDAFNKTMSVITPRLEGAVIKRDESLKLDAVEIESCTKPASVVVASLEKEKSVIQAKRILLVFATNALNSGETFENASMQVMLEVGKLPVLLETAKLSLKLRTQLTTSPKVYPLHLDGSRMEAIPAALDNGILTLPIDTARLPYGAVFFEISFP